MDETTGNDQGTATINATATLDPSVAAGIGAAFEDSLNAMLAGPLAESFASVIGRGVASGMYDYDQSKQVVAQQNEVMGGLQAESPSEEDLMTKTLLEAMDILAEVTGDSSTNDVDLNNMAQSLEVSPSNDTGESGLADMVSSAFTSTFSPMGEATAAPSISMAVSDTQSSSSGLADMAGKATAGGASVDTSASAVPNIVQSAASAIAEPKKESGSADKAGAADVGGNDAEKAANAKLQSDSAMGISSINSTMGNLSQMSIEKDVWEKQVFRPYIERKFAEKSPEDGDGDGGGSLLEDILTAGAAVLGFGAGLLVGFGSELLKSTKAVFNSIKSVFSGAWNKIKSGCSSAWKYIKGEFKSSWKSVTSSVKNGWAKVTTSFKSGWKTVTSSVSKGWQTVTSKFTGGMKSITSSVSSGWGKITDLFKKGFDKVKSLGKSAVNGVKSAGKKAKGLLGTIGGGLKKAAKSVGGGIKKAASAVGGGIKKVAKTVGSGAKKAGSLIANSKVGKAASTAFKVGKGAGKVLGKVFNVLPVIEGGMKTINEFRKGNIKGGFKALGGTVLDAGLMATGAGPILNLAAMGISTAQNMGKGQGFLDALGNSKSAGQLAIDGLTSIPGAVVEGVKYAVDTPNRNKEKAEMKKQLDDNSIRAANRYKDKIVAAKIPGFSKKMEETISKLNKKQITADDYYNAMKKAYTDMLASPEYKEAMAQQAQATGASVDTKLMGTAH